MNLWQKWRDSMRRAARWDHPSPEDEELRRLRGLFRAAPADDPAADARLWMRLRHQLDRAAEVDIGATIGASLALFGPRFATAAVFAFLMTASFFWYNTTAPGSPEPVSLAALAQPEESEGGFERVLDTRDGGELLQYIAYNPPGR